MGETSFVKIACPSCSEHVEFPMEMRGHVINCPHCTLSLVLELPGMQPQTPPPANLYQRLRALNDATKQPVPQPDADSESDPQPVPVMQPVPTSSQPPD